MNVPHANCTDPRDPDEFTHDSVLREEALDAVVAPVRHEQILFTCNETRTCGIDGIVSCDTVFDDQMKPKKRSEQVCIPDGCVPYAR